MTYLYIGIIAGIFIAFYIFPILDLFLECLKYKISEISTKSQLNSQEMVFLFNREYPEANGGQELHPAIGFQVSSGDEYYDEEYDESDYEDKIKNKIGFI